MRADEEAVGGFFEDLPVLVFVLAGVSVLVSSAVWAEQELARDRADAELEFAAEILVGAVCAHLFPADGVLPTVDSLRTCNLSQVSLAAAPGQGCAVAVRERYPADLLLYNESVGCSVVPDVVASASRLMNAVDSRGLTVVVEVRASVWQAP